MNTILRKDFLFVLFQQAMLFIKVVANKVFVLSGDAFPAQVVQQGLGISGGEPGERNTGARECQKDCGRGL